ncbi:MAG TPA: hypothetical protein DD671_13200 [Balneolaceae bacterium]|nr:hypothetical protein [Balneolaceae bacterium]
MKKVYKLAFLVSIVFMIVAGAIGNSAEANIAPCVDMGCLESGNGPDGVACYYIPGLNCGLQSSTECTTELC